MPYKVVRDESVGHLINDAGCILLEHITKREKPIAKVHDMPHLTKPNVARCSNVICVFCLPGLSMAWPSLCLPMCLRW